MILSINISRLIFPPIIMTTMNSILLTSHVIAINVSYYKQHNMWSNICHILV